MDALLEQKKIQCDNCGTKAGQACRAECDKGTRKCLRCGATQATDKHRAWGKCKSIKAIGELYPNFGISDADKQELEDIWTKGYPKQKKLVDKPRAALAATSESQNPLPVSEQETLPLPGELGQETNPDGEDAGETGGNGSYFTQTITIADLSKVLGRFGVIDEKDDAAPLEIRIQSQFIKIFREKYPEAKESNDESVLSVLRNWKDLTDIASGFVQGCHTWLDAQHRSNSDRQKTESQSTQAFKYIDQADSSGHAVAHWPPASEDVILAPGSKTLDTHFAVLPPNDLQKSTVRSPSAPDPRNFRAVVSPAPPGFARVSYADRAGSQYVITNHLTVKKVPPKLHEYTFGFIKARGQDKELHEVKRRSEIKRIWAALLDNNFQGLKERKDWATDFKQLWSLNSLPFAEKEDSVTVSVQYAKQSGRLTDCERFTLNKSTLGPINLSPAPMDIVESAGGAQNHSQRRVRALNAIIAKQVTSQNNANLVQIGPNKFFLRHRNTDIGSFRLVRGYFSSIRPGSDNILLNINATTSAFFNAPTLVSTFYQRMRAQHVRHGEIQRMLKGVTMRLAHTRPALAEDDKDKFVFNIDAERFRTRVFTEFGKPVNLQMVKPKKDGPEQEFESFYYEQGNPRVQDPDSLCVNVGLPFSSDRGLNGAYCIPAEHLELAFDQIFNKILPTTDLQSRMIDTARRDPSANLALITREGIPVLGLEDSKHLEGLEFKVDSQLLQVPAKKLEPPTVSYPSGSAKIGNTSWNLSGAIFPKDRVVGISQAVALSWKTLEVLIIKRDGGVDSCTESKLLSAQPSGSSFEDNLLAQLRSHGIVHKDCRVFVKETTWDADLTFDGMVDQFVEDIGGLYTPAPPILLVILPDQDEARYSAIKTAADCKTHVKTICCAWNKLSRSLTDASHAGNLSLKYWMKVGGYTHDVLLTPVSDKKKDELAGWLVLGADVTHPGTGATEGCPSVAAVVGSMNGTTHYPGSMRLQAGRQEHISQLNEMAAECIVRWVLQNQQSPKGLLFYRDGVAESQYKKIADFEVPQLDAAWARAKILLAERKIRTTLNSKCPSKIVIIVGKRHNVRFYPVNEDQSYFQKNRVRSSKSIIQTVGEGKSTRKVWSDTLNGNLKPGYVIDRVVTHPYAYDFFLQSHAAIEGTARSAHYYVLVNDPKWKPEKLHRVTHGLCYAYSAATKGISYCAPAYCADRLCDRGRRYLWDCFRGTAIDFDLKRFLDKDEQKLPNSETLFRERVARQLAEVWATRGQSRTFAKALPWASAFDHIMFYL